MSGNHLRASEGRADMRQQVSTTARVPYSEGLRRGDRALGGPRGAGAEVNNMRDSVYSGDVKRVR